MSDTLDLLIRAPRAIVDGREIAVAVGVRAGRIVHLGSFATSAVAGEVVELGSDEVLIPGLVDTHV
ncbi:MAG: allantoinase, partial [Rhodococcus sp. (in: high G+C Gram-positive bacteria)]